MVSEALPSEFIWIIGDMFVATTYPKGGLLLDDSFMKTNYGVVTFHNENHFDKNLLSRLRNVLVAALNKYDKLPSVILFALDSDVIKFLDHEDYGASIALGKIMDALVTSVHEVVKNKERATTKKVMQDKYSFYLDWSTPTSTIC